MIVLLVVSKLLRGPGGGKESIVGLDICDLGAWITFALLVLASIPMTYAAARIASKEYQAKTNAGYEFVAGDQSFGGRELVKLIAVAYFAAFASGFAGISPGTIFNSIFVQLDMHPAVASATGMYCTLFTTLAASTILLLNEDLNLPYSAMICVITLIGTMPGLYG